MQDIENTTFTPIGEILPIFLILKMKLALQSFSIF